MFPAILGPWGMRADLLRKFSYIYSIFEAPISKGYFHLELFSFFAVYFSLSVSFLD